jgi:hypothetical protein
VIILEFQFALFIPFVTWARLPDGIFSNQKCLFW